MGAGLVRKFPKRVVRAGPGTAAAGSTRTRIDPHPVKSQCFTTAVKPCFSSMALHKGSYG